MHDGVFGEAAGSAHSSDGLAGALTETPPKACRGKHDLLSEVVAEKADAVFFTLCIATAAVWLVLSKGSSLPMMSSFRLCHSCNFPLSMPPCSI